MDVLELMDIDQITRREQFDEFLLQVRSIYPSCGKKLPDLQPESKKILRKSSRNSSVAMLAQLFACCVAYNKFTTTKCTPDTRKTRRQWQRPMEAGYSLREETRRVRAEQHGMLQRVDESHSCIGTRWQKPIGTWVPPYAHTSSSGQQSPVSPSTSIVQNALDCQEECRQGQTQWILREPYHRACSPARDICRCLLAPSQVNEEQISDHVLWPIPISTSNAVDVPALHLMQEDIVVSVPQVSEECVEVVSFTPPKRGQRSVELPCVSYSGRKRRSG